MKKPLQVGFGFRFGELFDPLRLADLTRTFDEWFERREPKAHARLMAYRKAGGKVPPKELSETLVNAAPHVSEFVAMLFGIENERERLRLAHRREERILEWKREVIKRRVLKRAADSTALATARPAFLAVLLALGVEGGERADELLCVEALLPLFGSLDRLQRVSLKGTPTSEDFARADRVRMLAGKARIALPPLGSEDQEKGGAGVVAAFLAPVERYLQLWIRDHEEHAGKGGEPHPWVSLRLPRKLEYEHLVELRRPDPGCPESPTAPSPPAPARRFRSHRSPHGRRARS